MPASTPYEIELKLTLPDEAAWRRVRAELTDRRVERQRNVFFDRPDRALREARIGVRLRRTDERHWLAVKSDPVTASSPQAALARRVELEVPIPAAVHDAASSAGLDLRPWLERWRVERADEATKEPALAAFLERLARLTASPLVPIGGFDNERTRGRLALDGPGLPGSIELELDRTRFPGDRTDYEIEVELAGDTSDADAERLRAALVEHLSDRGIRTGTTGSKLARFLAILDAR